MSEVAVKLVTHCKMISIYSDLVDTDILPCTYVHMSVQMCQVKVV